MKNINIPVLPLLFLAGLLAATYGTYKTVEFEEVEYYSAASAEVIANPLIAAGRLLKETEGFTFELAKNRNIFSNLEKSNVGVLWLADLNELEDKREAETMLQWVKNGGMLMTSPAGKNVFDDSSIPGWLMAELGIESALNDNQSAADIERSGPVIVPIPDETMDAPAVLINSQYEQYFQNSFSDKQDTETIIDSRFLIHKKVGKGYFTLYADEQLFHNKSIKAYEQSYLLLWLTQPANPKSIAIVFRPADKPGLFKVIWSKFSLAVCLLALALLGFLRWASLRLGPVEEELPPIKNNLIAHLEARGTYLHRHKHTTKVLDEIRQSAIEALVPQRRNVKEELSLSASERETVILLASKRLACSRAQSEHLLFGNIKGDAAIVRTSQALQKILHRNQIKPSSVTE